MRGSILHSKCKSCFHLSDLKIFRINSLIFERNKTLLLMLGAGCKGAFCFVANTMEKDATFSIIQGASTLSELMIRILRHQAITSSERVAVLTYLPFLTLMRHNILSECERWRRNCFSLRIGSDFLQIMRQGLSGNCNII